MFLINEWSMIKWSFQRKQTFAQNVQICMPNPQTFKRNSEFCEEINFAEANANGAQFRELKLDQNFTHFLPSTLKSLLIYISTFFAEILHSLTKHIIPKFCAKSGNLRNFFYMWDAQKYRMCSGLKIAEYSHNYFLIPLETLITTQSFDFW